MNHQHFRLQVEAEFEGAAADGIAVTCLEADAGAGGKLDVAAEVRAAISAATEILRG